MSLPTSILRRGCATGLLLLFLLYLGAPLAHTLHHACAHGHHAVDTDAKLRLAPPERGHHAGDCPLCQTFLHATPVLATAWESPASTTVLAPATAHLTALVRLPPSVCWTGPRGPPAA